MKVPYCFTAYKKKYLNKCCIFFKDKFPYIISELILSGTNCCSHPTSLCDLYVVIASCRKLKCCVRLRWPLVA